MDPRQAGLDEAFITATQRQLTHRKVLVHHVHPLCSLPTFRSSEVAACAVPPAVATTVAATTTTANTACFMSLTLKKSNYTGHTPMA
jgi:hypothetical protein